MTRKTGNKKLTRQNPVIPPIKEGEELVELSKFYHEDTGCLTIERGADSFCVIFKF